MAIVDKKTPRLALPLPNVDNYLEDDVARLSDALTILDQKVATVGDDGKVTLEQLPAVAITDTFPVNSADEMLALNAQKGDVAIVTSDSGRQSYILMAEPASTLSNWKLLNDNQQNEKNLREQWRRSLTEAGLTLVDGSFEEGATVSSKTDAVWHIAVGQCYTWDGAFPKTVPADSTPTSTGGVGPSAWVSVGDASLRSSLAGKTSNVPIGGVAASKIASNVIATEYLESPNVYDVFVTYGQSNSAGEAILSGDTSGFPAPLPKSLMYDFGDGTIKPITQNVVSSSGVASSGHAWGEFENEWYRLSGRGSVEIHCGRGATTIAQLSKGTTYYTLLVNAVASAKQAMISAGLPIGKTYVLFHQGESDMSAGTTYNAYRDRLIALIDNLKTDINFDLFCNFTVGCPGNRTEESWAAIQNAQRWVCNNKTNAVTVFDGCPAFLKGDGNIGTNDGGVHYTQRGYNTMGREGAKGLWSIVEGGASNKTSTDLAQYSNFAPPWTRSKLVAGTIKYSNSSAKWVLLSKDVNSEWKISNAHKLVVSDDGEYFSVEIADNAEHWFCASAAVNRTMGIAGVRSYAEPLRVGNAFTLKITVYADVSFLVNTRTGEIRYGRPPVAGAVPEWISSNISVSVISPGAVEITHGRTSSMPSATYFASSDGTETVASVSVYTASTALTRVYCDKASTNNPWVVVTLRDLLITPANLQSSGISINFNGVYAPSL